MPTYKNSLIILVGLGSYMLSRGQKQHITIAKALI
jgi:ABC-type methionine transport system ATPase subunit